MKAFARPGRWAAALGLAAIALLVAGGVLAWVRDRAAPPDPRVSHTLYGWMVVLHVLAVCCAVAVAAVLLYTHIRTLPPQGRGLFAVAVCLPVLLFAFVLFVYDTLAEDAREYGAYQVLDVPDSEVDLVVQKYSYGQVLGAHVYLEEEGGAGRYLGSVGPSCVESLERGAYRIVNHGDGRVTIRWQRGDTYIWDDITFGGLPELP